jgi:hypothetical protein
MHTDEAQAETAAVVAGRELAKGKAVAQTRGRTPCRRALPPARERRRAAARKDRTRRLTALWHQVYASDRLREASHGLTRDATLGGDGQTGAA